MTITWPRRSPGLPPGQRLLTHLPRFTDRPFMAPPALPDPTLHITMGGVPIAEIDRADLDALGPRDIVADFHCVTTWSVVGLTWRGVPLRELLARASVDAASVPFMVARSADRRRAHFVVEDALADTVLIATHLDGEALGPRHGGPLRLVAPAHYGYKSVKHVIALDFTTEAPRTLGKEHLRGRVAHEERHPTLPSWLVKLPYRSVIPLTAHLAERSLRS